MTAFNVGGPNNLAVLDINAIEAIDEFAIPEPGAVLLVLVSLLCGTGLRRWNC